MNILVAATEGSKGCGVNFNTMTLGGGIAISVIAICIAAVIIVFFREML